MVSSVNSDGIWGSVTNFFDSFGAIDFETLNFAGFAKDGSLMASPK
jgi:hypothetical protein